MKNWKCFNDGYKKQRSVVTLGAAAQSAEATHQMEIDERHQTRNTFYIHFFLHKHNNNLDHRLANNWAQNKGPDDLDFIKAFETFTSSKLRPESQPFFHLLLFTTFYFCLFIDIYVPF